jgi:hypothetical protein
MGQQSYSQSEDAPRLDRWIYLWRLGLMYLERILRRADFSYLAGDLSFYAETFAKRTGRDLRQARILELGFGQRPFRLILLQSLGYDVRGIDLDQPLYQADAKTLLTLFKSNGWFRAVKSAARTLIFDKVEYRALADYISKRHGKRLNLDLSTLIIGDLADPKAWTRAGTRFDLVYSEDVFEHIPRQLLPKVVSLIAASMSDNSVAIITPMIFTGISGGHDLDWYPHRVDMEDPSRTPAWGHLTGEAVLGDTYLNKLSRKEFREVFEAEFDIVHEQETRPDLGRQHLTVQRRSSLQAFNEDELFSNTVRFVLRKKKPAV